jgi:ureidoacrylate peracid hydrolase
MQNYTARPDGGEYASLSAEERDARYGYFFRMLRETAIPNIQRLQSACRQARIEVMFTVIESLTLDGRDSSLDYKISGLSVPRGSWDAQVLDEVAPDADEIVLPKTSSSVFISTNIDYVLRNLGVRYLMVAGGLTDQCVDSAVRDACDLGYLVTCVTDACATLTQDRHDWALRNNGGYCRQRTTAQVVAEIGRLTAGAGQP